MDNNKQNNCPCEDNSELTVITITDNQYGHTTTIETIRATVDPDYLIHDTDSDLGA